MKEYEHSERDDVIGYQINGETLCEHCIEPDELKAVMREDLILESQKDDHFVFRDRCKEQI